MPELQVEELEALYCWCASCSSFLLVIGLLWFYYTLIQHVHFQWPLNFISKSFIHFTQFSKINLTDIHSVLMSVFDAFPKRVCDHLFCSIVCTCFCLLKCLSPIWKEFLCIPLICFNFLQKKQEKARKTLTNLEIV